MIACVAKKKDNTPNLNASEGIHKGVSKVSVKPKVGRPTDYNPKFCAKVIELGRQGKSRCVIAGSLDICFNTLTEWESVHPEFLQAMLRSKQLSQMWWEEQGQLGVWTDGFNANAYRLQVCNRFPNDWRDRPETSVTVNNELSVSNSAPEEWSQAQIEAELKRREEIPQFDRIPIKILAAKTE
jgi:hypothetical protein